MTRPFARAVCATLALSTASLSMPASRAWAGTVGTEEVMRGEAGARLDRDVLRGLLERDDVRVQLEARGVDARAARERVDALTDDEVAELAGRIGALPAGGADVLGVIFAVFLILLVTDILGLTKVFPFTRPVR
ncbi:MAG: hypothetical protein RJA99_1551 [Pseudomonadota bacterium]|jgi:Spy/CpxP family protein refolding chaperone